MPTTVLLVDDHASFRHAARLLLEMEGYDVVGEADCGEDGIRAAGELRPDLVLLDIQMPGIDGFETAARLTANGGGPAVILISSQDGADFGDVVESSGARGFIPKADLSGDRIRALAA